jgi:hypothetical protein
MSGKFVGPNLRQGELDLDWSPSTDRPDTVPPPLGRDSRCLACGCNWLKCNFCGIWWYGSHRCPDYAQEEPG